MFATLYSYGNCACETFSADDWLAFKSEPSSSRYQYSFAMRALLYSILSLATLRSVLAGSPVQAAAISAPVAGDIKIQTAVAAKPSDSLNNAPPETIFNGQAVPPMKEISGVTLGEEISKGYW